LKHFTGYTFPRVKDPNSSLVVTNEILLNEEELEEQDKKAQEAVSFFFLSYYFLFHFFFPKKFSFRNLQSYFEEELNKI